MGLSGGGSSDEPFVVLRPLGEVATPAIIAPLLAADGPQDETTPETPDNLRTNSAIDTGVVSWPAQLSDAEMDRVMELAEVPQEWRADMKAIAWCESKWSPGAVGDAGNSRGIMQLAALWFAYAGEDPEAWGDPVVNMRAALGAVRYDIARGYDLYRQWTCRH